MRAWPFFIAFVLGCAGFISMAPLGFAPFLCVALSGLYILLRQAPGSWSAAARGYSFGLGYFIPGLYWVGNALLVAGNAYWWVWPIAALGLPAFMALFPAMTSAVVHGKKLIHPGGFIGFIGAFTLAEWIRGHIATGLPWNLYGYAASHILPLAQVAALWDIYLLTFLAIFWAALPGYVWCAWDGPWGRSALILAGTGCVLLVGAFTFGTLRLAANPTTFDADVHLRIVQPSIDQAERWEPSRISDHLRRTLLLSYPGGLQQEQTREAYVFWPETALSRPYLADPQFQHAIGTMLDAQGAKNAFLVTGFVEYQEDLEHPENAKYYNAIALINNKARILHRYDKAHLVPFGEYIPFAEYISGIAPMSAQEVFTPGKGPGTLWADSDFVHFAGQICYESIFPGTVVSPEAKGDKRPVAIVNMTNDAWYGVSPGPYQHFDHARLRAVEEGLPLIRASASGISGVIDPLGRVLVHSTLFGQEALTSFLPLPLARLSDSLPWPLNAPGGRNRIFVCFLVVLCVFLFWARTATMRRYESTYT